MTTTTKTAYDDMQDQLTRNDGYAYSLHSMWRATGYPEGKSPEQWAEMASKFIEGLQEYRATVARKFPDNNHMDFSEGPVLWRVKAEDVAQYLEWQTSYGLDPEADPHGREGDLMACAELARFYAIFLDGDRERAD